VSPTTTALAKTQPPEREVDIITYNKEGGRIEIPAIIKGLPGDIHV
jgi:hypothetical protein